MKIHQRAIGVSSDPLQSGGYPRQSDPYHHRSELSVELWEFFLGKKMNQSSMKASYQLPDHARPQK